MMHSDKMELEVKQFGWKRNWDYIKANFIIMLKTLIEYKIAMFSAFLEQLSFFIIQFFFFKVLSDNFADTIGWTLFDFILFAFLIDFMVVISGFVIWGRNLTVDLKVGTLNLYLMKPMNKFFSYQFSNFSITSFIMIIMNLIIFPIFLIHFKINLFNIYYGLAILVLIVFFHIVTGLFLKSISFWSFGLSESLYNLNSEIVYNFAQQYPWQFFKNLSFHFISFSFAIIFISSLLIPVLRGHEIWNIYIQLSILVGMILLLIIGTVINWHYGLKKYEAFG